MESHSKRIPAHGKSEQRDGTFVCLRSEQRHGDTQGTFLRVVMDHSMTERSRSDGTQRKVFSH